MDGRGEQRIARRIESLAAATVCGQQLLQMQINAEQVADGVVIFSAIQPTAHDVAAIEIRIAIRRDLIAVCFLRFRKAAQPAHQLLLFGESEFGLSLGRHFIGLDAFEHGLPDFVGLDDFVVFGK